MSLDNLRSLLDERICRNLDLASHTRALEEIDAVEPHSIKIVELAPAAPEDDFNCVMFALDLYIQPATQGFLRPKYFADTEFLMHLIDSGYLAEAQGGVVDGNLAVYFSGDRATHVGKIGAGGRIVSKWGCGHVYDHMLFEVGTSYGDEVRCFQSISSDVALAQLKRFRALK